MLQEAINVPRQLSCCGHYSTVFIPWLSHLKTWRLQQGMRTVLLAGVSGG